MDSLRHVPLLEPELKLYNKYVGTRDSFEFKKTKNSRVFWGEVGDFLISDININLANVGSVRCSPIINPFLLSYGRKSGFAWRQDFKFNRLFNDDKLLRIVPRIGYNFTRKEYYWCV